MLTLPLLRLLGAAAAGGAGVGAVAWAAVALLSPDRAPGVYWGVVGAWGACALGVLVMRPWKPRHLGRWPMAWLAGRGASFFGVLAAAGLLYSAARPDPLVFGLTLAGAYFGALMAEVAAYAAYIKRRTGSHPI